MSDDAPIPFDPELAHLIEEHGPYPQAGRRRMIAPHPVGWVGTGVPDPEPALLAQMGPDAVFMMGDNPALPRFPKAPKLLDFFRLGFGELTSRHLLTSGKKALEDGHDEKIVIAALLHDISNGCL